MKKLIFFISCVSFVSCSDKTAKDCYEIGEEMMRQGYSEKAINHYTEALSIDPKFADAYYSRAGAYFEEMQYDYSILDSRHFLKLSKDNNEAKCTMYESMARCFYLLKNYDKAIELIDSSKIFRSKISLRTIDVYLAMAYARTNKLDSTCNILLSIKPKDLKTGIAVFKSDAVKSRKTLDSVLTRCNIKNGL